MSPTAAVMAALDGSVPTPMGGDEQLVEGLRRRDAIAPERFVERYGARAYRLAIGITRNAADAEEVVQDALWSAVDKIDTFRGDAALGSWFYRIVVNAAFQKLRGRGHQRTEISLEQAWPSLHGDDPQGATFDDWSQRLEDPALQHELRSALSAAIDELPPDYRAVVVLRDVDGLAVADVASSTGITVANAKTRLHRARLFLRTRLASFMTSSARPRTLRSEER